ncbi:carbamoyl-phosphate synthase subunit L [Cycloclasticus sp. 44_32_T64]|nr:carbamoyl-phosphate synthase subunit L [Cycloclasticus sp. 44_32_T64]
MNKFNTILIANRGEIAVRVIKTAKEMGYETVAVFSEADRAALHVSLADTAVCIGESSVDKSYLNINNIIDAAKKTNAEAIHPGYGFLSESTEFARRCEEAGLVFIGPSSHAIAVMGNKTVARHKMLDADVPLVPGYDGPSDDEQVLQQEADRIGYPVMVKAAAGGGGRGIRIVREAQKLKAEVESARAEALSSFGSSELLLEKCVEQARHIEIQVFADQAGNTVYLGERDCSMQRRNQKVIEEAPAPDVSPALRKKMGEAAVQAAKAVNYTGAGTVEFLLTQDQEFYFLEMNTRLQVEHPVTELITGLDLVEWQLRVAAGERLPLSQDDIQLQGHAIEVRLYAEDCDAGFVPQTGQVLDWKIATGKGIRVDNGLVKGQIISPYYDSMLAKLIAYGGTREEAIRRLKRALKDTVLLGLSSNKQFLLGLLDDPVFIKGNATTRHIEEQHLPAKEQAGNYLPRDSLWAIAAIVLSRTSGATGWRSTGVLSWPVRLRFQDVLVDFTVSQEADKYTVESEHIETKTIQILVETEGQLSLQINGILSTACVALDERQHVYIDNRSEVALFEKLSFSEKRDDEELGANLTAPMSGRIAGVKVKTGDKVSKGDLMVVLESMKMFQELTAQQTGVVSDVYVMVDQQVEVGIPLIDVAISE